MTDRLDRPTYDNQISALKQRVDALERRLRRTEAVGPPELTFVFPGTVITDTSPKKRNPVNRLYRVVMIDLVTAGTTPTVIRILKNGAAHGADITIAANDNAHEVRNLSLGVGATQDYVQVRVVTPGSGAKGLTVDLWQTAGASGAFIPG